MSHHRSFSENFLKQIDDARIWYSKLKDLEEEDLYKRYEIAITQKNLHEMRKINKAWNILHSFNNLNLPKISFGDALIKYQQQQQQNKLKEIRKRKKNKTVHTI